MSTSGFSELTLHAQNSSVYSTTVGEFRNCVLLCMEIVPDWIPYDAGAREDGIDTTAFQNIARLFQVDTVVYPFTRNQGTAEASGVSWDDGSYEQIIRVLSAKHLWVSAVVETGWIPTSELPDGTVHDRWVAAGSPGSILPLKVVAKWSASDMNIGARQWRRFALTLRAEKATVGVIIP